MPYITEQIKTVSQICFSPLFCTISFALVANSARFSLGRRQIDHGRIAHGFVFVYVALIEKITNKEFAILFMACSAIY